MAAPKVTNNGVACKIEASNDIGIKTMAEVKERAPNKSAIVRDITCLLSSIYQPDSHSKQWRALV